MLDDTTPDESLYIYTTNASYVGTHLFLLTGESTDSTSYWAAETISCDIVITDNCSFFNI